MNRTYRKNIFREIKQSFGRFIAMVAIVTLGVGFLTGILSTTPDMKYSVDRYYDENNLCDIFIKSTMGLTGDDLQAIKDTDGVEQADAMYSTDVLMDTGDLKNQVVRMYGLDLKQAVDGTGINQLKLQSGRMPEREDECLVIGGATAFSTYEIGSVLTMSSDNEDYEDLSDSYNCQTFTVVGIVTSPFYFSSTAETASIGSGKVDSVIYVDADCYALDVYTDIYITVEGAKGLEAFHDSYDDRVAEVTKRLENLAEEREDIRYNEILSDGREELDDGWATYEEEKANAEQELQDALSELQDGDKKLADAEQELADGKEELSDGWASYQSGYAEYLSRKAETEQLLEQNEQKLAESKKQLEDGYATLEDGQEQIDAAYAQLESGSAQLEAGYAQIQDGYDQIEQGKVQITAGIAQIDAGLEMIRAQLSVGETASGEQAESGEPVASEEQAESGEQATSGESVASEASDEMIQILKQKQAELETQKEQLNAQLTSLEEQEAQLDAQKQVLDEQKAQLESGRQLLDEQQAELDEGREQLDAGMEQYTAGYAQFLEGKNTAEAEFNEAAAELASAREKLESSEAELQDGEAQLEQSRTELEDGWSDYYDGKEEADEKFADALAELQDGEQELEELEEPEWYVLDRGSNVTYASYAINVEKVAAVAKVFPVFFFLIAALVSLTTMTRMIEEGREQIGTMKALGYGPVRILSKYIIYSGLAAGIGCVAGLAIGFRLLPVLINQAYSSVYTLPTFYPQVNIFYATLSCVLEALCTVGVTVWVCLTTLREKPAELMRPKTPSGGCRIFLERITPIWKRMSFSWKATARNIFRYKRHLIMTIVGISGCTALMLAGMLFRSALVESTQLQYGELFRYDVSLQYDSSDPDFDPAEVTDGNPYLDVYEKTLKAKATAGTVDVTMVCPDDMAQMSDFISLRDRRSGKSLNPDDNSVVLTEMAAKELGLEVGDTFEITDNDSFSQELTLTGITENYSTSYLYCSRNLLSDQPERNTLLIRMDIPDEDEDSILEELLEHSCVSGATLIKDSMETTTSLLGSLDYIIIVLVVAAGLLAVIVLYNLTNINIMERTKELATLKVLGYHLREVAVYIFREVMISSVISSFIGLGLGIALERYILVAIENAEFMVGRSIPAGCLIFAFGMTMLFSALVDILMMPKLKHIEMSDSMKAVD